jgi:hypothetical protein
MKQTAADHHSRDSEPWRRIAFNRKRPGKRGIASAQIRILNNWYDISIEMDIQGFRALTKLPEHSRVQLLDSLATMPVRSGKLDERRGGIHDEMASIARENAQWLGPLFLRFFQQCSRLRRLKIGSPQAREILNEMVGNRFFRAFKGTREENEFANQLLRIFQNTCDQMKSASQQHLTPHGMAAYIVEQRWCNRFKEWPQYSQAPTEDPVQFFKILKRGNHYKNPISPKPIHQLIDDVLKKRVTDFITPTKLKKTVPMASFDLSL